MGCSQSNDVEGVDQSQQQEHESPQKDSKGEASHANAKQTIDIDKNQESVDLNPKQGTIEEASLQNALKEVDEIQNQQLDHKSAQKDPQKETSQANAKDTIELVENQESVDLNPKQGPIEEASLQIASNEVDQIQNQKPIGNQSKQKTASLDYYTTVHAVRDQTLGAKDHAIIMRIQQYDRAYTLYKQSKSGNEQKIIIGHIECMAIENLYQLFLSSNEAEEHRFANSGKYTIDFKQNSAFLTCDPDNQNEQFRVERAETHKRGSRSDPAKFTADITANSLKVGNKNGPNWLGSQWQLRYSGKTDYTLLDFLPSPNQILKGIKEEQKRQLVLTSGLEEDSDKLKEALANILQVWEKVFSEIPEEQRDQPLTREILNNPEHSITVIILYLYTLDNFLFLELNKGSREGDTAKIDTLGPYAATLAVIFYGRASQKRTDINDLKHKLEVEGIPLYRAGGFPEDKIQEYRDCVGKTQLRRVAINEIDPETGLNAYELQETPALITLTGYISTSLDKNAAEQFAWSNSETGHEATLFIIMWKAIQGYFVMDMSALPHEQEILLEYGAKFEVLSVEKAVDQYGDPINHITLKHEYYDARFREPIKKTFGYLQNFEGEDEFLNGLRIKIITQPKDGEQAIEIIDAESELKGAANYEDVNHIKANSEIQPPVTDEQAKANAKNEESKKD